MSALVLRGIDGAGVGAGALALEFGAVAAGFAGTVVGLVALDESGHMPAFIRGPAFQKWGAAGAGLVGATVLFATSKVKTRPLRRLGQGSGAALVGIGLLGLAFQFKLLHYA